MKTEKITHDFTISPEDSADDSAIDRLVLDTFGPGMFARAAYFLREGVPHCREFSFTARVGGKLAGSVRLTPVMVADQRILQLGPLAVSRDFKNGGIGKALMLAAIEATRTAPVEQTGGLIVLVGDLAYYGPLGFERVPHRQIVMPKPVDYARVLALELTPGRLREVKGIATRAG